MIVETSRVVSGPKAARKKAQIVRTQDAISIAHKDMHLFVRFAYRTEKTPGRRKCTLLAHHCWIVS
jgi:hypothetical protein